MTKQDQSFAPSRRSFLKGALAASAGVAAAASIPAMASAEQAVEAERVADEVIDTEIVVVGGGVAGLACAVQAFQNGNQVIILDKAPRTGGGALFGIQGMGAANSSICKANGVEFDKAQAVQMEFDGNGRWINPGLYADMFDRSGGNIDWLLECGCQFLSMDDEIVKKYPEGFMSPVGTHYQYEKQWHYNYHGDAMYLDRYDEFPLSQVRTYHNFKEQDAKIGYADPMTAKVEELGIEVRVNTKADSLIMTDGVATGVWATDEDGKTIQVNAKAVVLATGGASGNPEIWKKNGWKPDNIVSSNWSYPFNNGDGYLMAMEVGAKDYMPFAGHLAYNTVRAFGNSLEDPINGMEGVAQGGPCILVNAYGRRFCNDGVAYSRTWTMQPAAITSMGDTFTVFDQKAWNMLSTKSENPDAVLADALANGEGSFYTADTIEELASKFDIDPEALVATIERYNHFVEIGVDEDFGKHPVTLQTIDTPPYYIGKVVVASMSTIGGVWTTPKMEAVDDDYNVIPNLYAIGQDGLMMYTGYYNIEVPGMQSMNCVDSGRLAANAIHELIG